MSKRSFPLKKVYGLLETGPVVLITTEVGGKPNVMTQSWHTPLEFEPPFVGMVISDRNHSFAALSSTGECAINIPTKELAKAVAGCGNTSGRREDKFDRFGLTRDASKLINVSLIRECYASLECRVVDKTLVPQFGFFVVEVVKAWVDPSVKDPKTLHHRGRGRFMIAGKTVQLKSKML